MEIPAPSKIYLDLDQEGAFDYERGCSNLYLRRKDVREVILQEKQILLNKKTYK